MFAFDNHDLLPGQVQGTNGGALGVAALADAAALFAPITNYARWAPGFICPSDNKRSAPTFGKPLDRTNLSYFVSSDAKMTNRFAILLGDRHLQMGGRPVTPGLFPLSTNQTLGWTTELHFQNKQSNGGAVAFADGHVEWVGTANLANIVLRQSMPTNRVAIP